MNIDNMLYTEQCKNFKDIKRYYPHYYCGRGRSGNTVYYENCGSISVPSLTSLGITVPDLVRHYIYMTEFCLEVINGGREDARTITVFDVEGVGVGDLKGKVMEFIKSTTQIMQDHYPERSECILIVNAPVWFSAIWSIVSAFVNDRTKGKVIICSRGGTLEGMGRVIEHGEIPAKYGGGKVWGEGDVGGKDNGRWWSEDEVRFREWVGRYGGVTFTEEDMERMVKGED